LRRDNQLSLCRYVPQFCMILFEAPGTNERYNISVCRCRAACTLFWAVRKKKKKKKRKKNKDSRRHKLVRQTPTSLISSVIEIFLGYILFRKKKEGEKRSEHQNIASSASRCPSTAGLSPRVASAATTGAGVRPAHGEREVEQDERPHAGPARHRTMAAVRINQARILLFRVSFSAICTILASDPSEDATGTSTATRSVALLVHARSLNTLINCSV
jgi:hypothetical protein